MDDSTTDLAHEPQSVVLETIEDQLLGPLDEVLKNLIDLKTKYEADYTALAIDGTIETDPEDGSLYLIAELTGVPAYSKETLAKLDQIKVVLQSLPSEAASSFLKSQLKE